MGIPKSIRNIESSLKELEYAVSTLGVLGVKLPSNADGIYPGSEGQEELFAELDRQRLLVILHPSPARQLPRNGVVTGRVMALFEYPADTTRAVLNLLADGTLERHSDMKLLVPHCGSFLPYMRSRAKAMFAMLNKLSLMESVDIDKAMSKLYFDLAGDPMPEEMDMLLSVTDARHLVYGSDYPYVPASILLGKKAALDIELGKRQQLEQIYVANPRQLL